jgi:hypothetical protein
MGPDNVLGEKKPEIDMYPEAHGKAQEKAQNKEQHQNTQGQEKTKENQEKTPEKASKSYADYDDFGNYCPQLDKEGEEDLNKPDPFESY